MTGQSIKVPFRKNLGNMVLHGLKKPSFLVHIELKDDKGGRCKLPSEYRVMDLLLKIFVGKTQVFQSTLQGHSVSYFGFFLGINPHGNPNGNINWGEFGILAKDLPTMPCMEVGVGKASHFEVFHP